MNISDFLSQEDVLLDLPAQTKNGLLRDLAARAAQKLGPGAGQISSALLNRENLGSTGIGGGVAIPHARVDGISKPFGIIARLHKSIDFEAIDEKPVDLVFLLVLPQSNSEDSLSALALVARKLRDAKELERLRNARSEDALFATLTG